MRELELGCVVQSLRASRVWGSRLVWLARDPT